MRPGSITRIVLVASLLPASLAGQDAHRARPYASRCAAFARPDAARRYLAPADLHPPGTRVDGNALLALVDRSPRFALSPDYAPDDLVDLRSGRALPAWQCVPPDHQCLRREAATAFAQLTSALAHATHDRVWTDSAFRAYDIQCAVFANWAYRDRHGFCNATTFSAIPGHSQHQLGTAVDVFTEAWVHAGPRFRPGFGCADGGRWLAAHAWESGFVLPYPLHPDEREPGSDCASRPGGDQRVDPRTGYKYEPWHLRYIGVQNAARFHAAWVSSGPGTSREITLEQWLRHERGEPDLAEPATCDGCACDGCATFSEAGSPGPCADASGVERLGPDGAPRVATTPPSIERVRVETRDGVVTLRVTVRVPAATLTQPPVATRLVYRAGQGADHFARIEGGPTHAYPALAHTWTLGAGREGERVLPWRAALVEADRDDGVNGFNQRIPATSGTVEVRVTVNDVAAGTRLRVALVGEGVERDGRTVDVPRDAASDRAR